MSLSDSTKAYGHGTQTDAPGDLNNTGINDGHGRVHDQFSVQVGNIDNTLQGESVIPE